MQIQLFEDTSIYNIASVLVFLLTIPTIYLYFIPKHETMILVLYSFVLVFILDFLGKDVNIVLLLATLFSIFLLFTHSLYTANAKRTKMENPDYLTYLILLLVILFLVSLMSFFIYEKILKPNVNEKQQLEIMFLDKESNESENELEEEDIDSSGGASGGGSSEPINFIQFFKIILLLFLTILIIWLLYKIIRYINWKYKLSKSSKENQVELIYMYVLNSLCILKMGKQAGETPIEYFKFNSKNLPINNEGFKLLTNEYIRIKYGNKRLNDKHYNIIMMFFSNIYKDLVKNIGVKRYIIYLIKK